jgi:hypothetical protein
MGFPTNNEPIPPQNHDGVDVVTTNDMQWVEDTLTSIQGVIGANPADRTDINGESFGTWAENFRALCRIEIGSLPSSGWGTGTTLTVDGYTYDTPYELDYFKYYRHYFAEGRFTKPPLIFFPDCDPLYIYGSNNYAWRVTKDYFQSFSNGSTYIAIQPPFSD